MANAARIRDMKHVTPADKPRAAVLCDLIGRLAIFDDAGHHRRGMKWIEADQLNRLPVDATDKSEAARSALKARRRALFAQ